MSNLKALKNFSCNGVKKKAGEMLSDEDKKIIGKEFGEMLIKNDMIGSASVKKPDLDLKDEDLKDEEKSLDDMDKSELMEKAKNLGIKVHGASKEEKIREMINEHLSE